MTSHKFKDIPVDYVRLIEGLGRIGYTPTTALCDIIDNSVRAKPSFVKVIFEREEKVSDSRKNNVKEYVIIDDGIGMNEQAIINALSIGSIANYEANSLSKFGLGLKSSAFSQGDKLEVISSDGLLSFKKYMVSLGLIKDRGVYCTEELPLNERDYSIIEEYLREGRGTIIRLAQIHKNNHPSIQSTMNELKEKLGIIYYYFMRNENLKIYLEEFECLPFDPLFIEEATKNGSLDERTWNGTDTRWIQEPTSIVIDKDNNVSVNVEVTQLPHPPSCVANKLVERRSEILNKYKITSKNYGFYVYRNNRLISWAEDLGIMTQDKSLYGFRGRINIGTDADSLLNIDVKKSNIQLSEEVLRNFEIICDEYTSKSKKAWERAISETKKILTADPEDLADTIAKNIQFPDELPGELDSEEEYEEKKKRELKLIEENNKLKEQGSERLGDQTTETLSHNSGQTFKEQENKNSISDKRIKFNNNTTNLCLWEKDYDPRFGTSVVINPSLSFSKFIFEDLRENTQLSVILSIFLLHLVQAEHHVAKSFTEYDITTIKKILDEYRYVTTQLLTKNVDKLKEQLDEQQ